MPLRSLCLAALAAMTEADCSATCRRHQPCWPSRQEVQALHDALDPEATRTLHWGGGDLPLPAPVPIGSLNNQPLFGSNDNLEPLYEQSHDASWDCIFDTVFCRQAARNRPLKHEQPAFVAWPLNVDHVQKLLRFARAHNLGVSVAGTGHDFLNRHTCHQGIMIRTSLLKDINWQLSGTEGGSVRLGAGLNFAEIMHSGVAQSPPSYTVAGWAGTVGVVGWSLGGGHGPFARSRGFGAENLLSLQVVTADGEVVTASAENHPDLFWAMRGGGGSTWGVVTAVTLKAYATPPGGLATVEITAAGDACNEGLQGFDAVAHGWANWTVELGSRFSGIFDVTITPNDNETQCNGTWTHSLFYAFEGAPDDDELAAELKRFAASFGPTSGAHWDVSTPGVTPLSHWWDYLLTKPKIIDYIWTTRFTVDGINNSDGLASIAVDGDARDLMASKFVSMGKVLFPSHTAGNFQVYHDIPGQACPTRPAPNSTSLGRAFRDAEFHMLMGTSMNQQNQEWWDELGSGAYFGESAYTMKDWKQQYWGDHYDDLLEIKRQYDPTNLLWCHHCVGSDLPQVTVMQV